ncbi:phage terminase small subunit [Streptomyces tanashiensis]
MRSRRWIATGIRSRAGRGSPSRAPAGRTSTGTPTARSRTRRAKTSPGYKKSGKRSGQLLRTIHSVFERLLVAEGDRRRARIELLEPELETTSASVLARVDHKKDLGLQQ